jgi:flagellar assembly protein FliH
MSEEALGEAAVPWDVPTINGEGGKGYLTAGDLEKIQQAAYDEAWKKGHSDGIAAGGREIAGRAERFDELMLALSEPFDQLDDVVEEQLIELSIAVAKQLFRREISIEPSHIVGIAREAIQALPIASRNVMLHLHPDDAELIRAALRPAEHEPAWAIVEDSLLARGSCRVSTENSQIDATADARLSAIVNRIFHDERES